jgi:Asp-tRNA(Asn)/Glu-tRNA(Gln) amidotransferase A subunit family amidase
MITQNDNISKACDKLEKIDQHIHSFLPEKNRKERLISDMEKYKPKPVMPLYGMFAGIKDIFRVDGLLTRAGSKLPARKFSGIEASVVTKIKKNGALILGKTVTTEFAFAEPNETVNPVNHKYSPGGSSSGSAAAVAAGLCDFAVGSQTVGSTLRPASYCGIVGFKCSYDRIDPKGVIYFAPSLDTIGLFTKDVTKMLKVSKALFKTWQDENEKQILPVLGVPVGKYLDQIDKDVLTIFNRTITRLLKNGYTVKRIPVFENIVQINYNIWILAAYEMAEIHKKWYAAYKHLYRSRTRELIEKGEKVTKEKHREMIQKQKELRTYIINAMTQNGIDLWVCPTTMSYAPKMTLSSTGNPAMNIPWTFAGLPSISLPIKKSGKLPLGLQIVARFGKDELLLSESKKIERIVHYE